MKMNHGCEMLISFLVILAWVLSLNSLVYAGATQNEGTIPVTINTFARAETHQMQKSIVDLGGFGKWHHYRDFTPIDQQPVVRMNRDTLYSTIVVDLTEPAVLVIPDSGERYLSFMIINEDHLTKLALYEPGEYTLTQDEMGSRYISISARILADAEDPEDLKQAHALQDLLQVKQKNIGKFEVPSWDQESLTEISDALKVLGRFLDSKDQAYGPSMEEVDPIAHLISTADAWGGWKPENAVYLNFVPEMNDGKTPYRLTLKDVPSGDSAFWSISVYNNDGYFEENTYGKYVINSNKAEKNSDGSVTVNFGGESNKANFLPIVDGWNYMLRIYLPQKPYFDGSWQAPAAEVAK